MTDPTSNADFAVNDRVYLDAVNQGNGTVTSSDDTGIGVHMDDPNIPDQFTNYRYLTHI
jgi:hypothetical protein